MSELDPEELEQRAKLTLDMCGGIQPMHISFYALSISYSAERALAAFELYDHLIEHVADAASLISSVQDAGVTSEHYLVISGHRPVEKRIVNTRLD